LAHSGRAISYCKKCHELDKNNAKALYLHGKALSMLCDFDQAEKYLKSAQRIKPNSKEINEELKKLHE